MKNVSQLGVLFPYITEKKCLKPPASTGKQWTNGFTDWVYDGWIRIWTLDFHELSLDETRRYPRVFPNCSFQPFMEVSDISGEFSPCKNGPWLIHTRISRNKCFDRAPNLIGDELRCCWIHVPSAWSSSGQLVDHCGSLINLPPPSTDRTNSNSAAPQLALATVGHSQCLSCVSCSWHYDMLRKKTLAMAGKCPKITGLCVKTHSSLTKSHGTSNRSLNNNLQKLWSWISANQPKHTEDEWYHAAMRADRRLPCIEIACGIETDKQLQANTYNQSCTDQIRVIIHWR